MERRERELEKLGEPMASDQHISGPFLERGDLWSEKIGELRGTRILQQPELKNRESPGGRHCVPIPCNSWASWTALPSKRPRVKVRRGFTSAGSAGLDSRSEGPDGTTVWPLRRRRHCHRPDPPVLVLLLRTTCCCSPLPAQPRTCSSSPRRAPGRPRPAAR